MAFQGLIWGLLISLLATSQAMAHSGGLDKHGCHTNRATGDYHCHRGNGPARSPLAPLPSARASNSMRQNLTTTPGAGRAFANCSEARAAGAAPVRRGDPGYGPHLNRDNDGVGCEPYRGR